MKRFQFQSSRKLFHLSFSYFSFSYDSSVAAGYKGSVDGGMETSNKVLMKQPDILEETYFLFLYDLQKFRTLHRWKKPT